MSLSNNKEQGVDSLRLSTDFKYFCSWSGPDPFNSQELRITKQHMELVQMLMTGKDSVVVAYRGRGKSTLVSFKYALRRATQHNKTVTIFSANEDLAVDKLRLVKTAIETFPQLQKYLGKGIYTWNDKEIWLIDRDKGREGPDGKMHYPVISRIKAVGFESRFRGLHSDIVIADDIIIEENSLTQEGAPDIVKIDKVKRDFNAKAIPIRNPGGSIILVGTPQVRQMNNTNESDLLYVWKNNKRTQSFLLPALTESGDPSCPDLHSKEFLLQQKDAMRHQEWNKEYMLNPSITTETTIDDEVIEKCKDSKHSYSIDYIGSPSEVVLLGTDYVYNWDKDRAEKNDLAYFALVPVAYDQRTDNRKLLNIHYERGIGYTEQVELTLKWIKNFHCDVLCLELHGGLKLFESELRRLCPPHVNIIDASNHGNKFDRVTGLPSIEYLFNKRLVQLAYFDNEDRTKTDWLLHELRHMKSSTHVDVIDALLRVDSVIRKYYYRGESNPNFSVRKLMMGEDVQVTDLEEEMFTVFRRDEKAIERYKEEKQKEANFKQRMNNLDENHHINLSRLI